MIFYLGLSATIIAGAAFGFLVVYCFYSIMQEYRKDRVPALLYHQFRSLGKAGANNQEPVYVCYDTAFLEQLSFLHREGYTSISLDEFVAFQQGRKSLPPKPIILTFDDGFMSNYTIAFPILKRFGMKATLFVTPDTESRNFKKYAHSDSPLTPDQIKEMSDYGISIQSHAMTHRYLTDFEPEVIQWELQESKRVLEEMAKKPVEFIAIPSGAYNRTVRKLVKEAGYRASFCMLKGTNNATSNPYTLRRFVVARDYTLEDFKKMLQPSTGWQVRLTSFIQNMLFNVVLGPARCDAFRDALYRTRLGKTLIRGQLRYVVGSAAIVTLVTLFAGLLLLTR